LIIIVRIALLALGLSLVAPMPSPLAAEGAVPSYYKLANGLQLVVIPDHRTPVVTHMVWYKVGAADEPAGRSGIAHFLEHLMFKGTKDAPDGQFSKTVARFGGQENAFTSSDYTGYFQRVSVDHLERLMELEADRMTGLILAPEQVVPELKVVLEEQYQRVGNDPAAILGEQVAAALYLNHPYGRPVIGWRHEIEKLNRDYAIAFYRAHYTPSNAVVVIVGDISPEQAKALAEKTYGKVANTFEVAPRVRPQEPEPVAERRVTYADPRVTQPSLQRSYLVPSDTTASPGEAEALDVLTHILGSGSVSRLYRKLVVEKRLAAAAGAWYQSTALDPTRLAVYGVPRVGVSLADLEAGIDAVLDEVIASGVTAEELDRAKSRMVADMVYAQDNQSYLARMYGAALTTGMTVEQVRNWPERIKAVTADAVAAAAKKYLDKRRSATGYLVREEPRREGKRS
jgi:zinc protease